MAALAAAFVFAGCDKGELTDPNQSEQTEQTDPNNPSNPGGTEGTDPEGPNNPEGTDPDNPGGTDSKKEARNLEFSDSTTTVILGSKEFALPTLSGVTEGVEHSSSKIEVATVDAATGAVTLVAAGETIITAVAKETDTHFADTASYTLTVVAEKPAPVLTLESAEAVVAADKTSYELALTVNCAWTVETSDGVTANPTSGDRDTTVVLSFAANTAEESVIYTVTFKAEGLENQIFTLTQAAAEKPADTIQTVSLWEFLSLPSSDQVYRISGVIWEMREAYVVIGDVPYDDESLPETTGYTYIRGLQMPEGVAQKLKPGLVLTAVGKRGDMAELVDAVYESHKDYDQPFLMVPTSTKPILEATNATFELEVYSNCTWSVALPEGVTATPASGDGDAVVKFTFPDNNKIQEIVSYWVTFTYNGKQLKYRFDQNANMEAPEKPEDTIPTISLKEFRSLPVSDKLYRISGVIWEIGEDELYIGEIPFNYGLDLDEVAWACIYNFKDYGFKPGDVLTVVGKRGKDDEMVILVDAVYESHEDYDQPFLTFPVNEDGHWLSFEQNAQTATYSLEVYSNSRWSLILPDGITANPMEGDGDSVVNFTFPVIVGAKEITHKVTFVYNGTEVLCEFYQLPEYPYVSLSERDANVAADQTTYELNLTANCAWSVQVPAGMTANPTSGNGNAIITLAFPANKSDQKVEYMVNIYGDNYGYDSFTLTQAAEKFVAQPTEWGVVGDLNDWGNTGIKDVVMYNTSHTEGLYVAYNVNIASGSFKIRANNTWNDDKKNYGFEVTGRVYADSYYSVVDGGSSQDITPAIHGVYDVYFDLANKRVALMTPGKAYSEARNGGEPVTTVIAGLKDHSWGLIGTFPGNEWSSDYKKMEVEGDWAVVKNVSLKKNYEFKFRADNSWDLNYGTGCDVKAGEIYSSYEYGGNMKFVGEDGYYDLYFSLLDASFYMKKSQK